jgi:hypothetical protein
MTRRSPPEPGRRAIRAVDTLVNNAGPMLLGSIAGADAEGWDRASQGPYRDPGRHPLVLRAAARYADVVGLSGAGSPDGSGLAVGNLGIVEGEAAGQFAVCPDLSGRAAMCRFVCGITVLIFIATRNWGLLWGRYVEPRRVSQQHKWAYRRSWSGFSAPNRIDRTNEESPRRRE